MHSELSYGLSFAPKLQRVGGIHISGSDQPTPVPDPSFSHGLNQPCLGTFFFSRYYPSVAPARIIQYNVL